MSTTLMPKELLLESSMPLTTPLKNFLHRTFPKFAGTISSYRNNRKLKRISQKLIARQGNIVLHGPFAGMKYVPRSVGSVLNPKLIGSYELEIHPFLDQIFQAHYDSVIDIGCAEGYYAVGFALKFPHARIYAFDPDPTAHHLCKTMSELNGVAHQLAIAGSCDLQSLSQLSLERALIFCDCEGCELELLRPDVLPALGQCDLLIELHDFIEPSISKTIFSRFADTHDIQLVSSTEHDPALYPELDMFSPLNRRLAVAEFRPGIMEWAFMKSKSIPPQGNPS